MLPDTSALKELTLLQANSVKHNGDFLLLTQKLCQPLEAQVLHIQEMGHYWQAVSKRENGLQVDLLRFF